jgi:hypothetical protein
MRNRKQFSKVVCPMQKLRCILAVDYPRHDAGIETGRKRRGHCVWIYEMKL